MPILQQLTFTLEEAKRMFKLALHRAGYSYTGIWSEYNKQVFEMALLDKSKASLAPLRAVMWPYDGDWQIMLSVKVGEHGEFPLTSGELTHDFKLQPIQLVVERMESLLPTLKDWHHERANYWQECLARLARFYQGREQYDQAIEVLDSLIKGEFSKMTIEQTLSLAMFKWGTRREEMLHIADVWWRQYEPRVSK